MKIFVDSPHRSGYFVFTERYFFVIAQPFYSRLIPKPTDHCVPVSHVDKKACMSLDVKKLFFTILKPTIVVDNKAVVLSFVCKFTYSNTIL